MYTYQLISKDTSNIIAERHGFNSATDAELQAEMDVTVQNIKNIQIKIIHDEIQFVYIFGPVVKWSKTPPFHGGNTGSNPVRITKHE